MSKPVETEFYDLLNIKYNASDDEIKKAYLKLAQKEHPDKCADRTPEGIQKATEKFQYINYVKNILSDSNKRAIYDREGKSGLEEAKNQDNGGGGNPFDMFQQMFGRFNMGGFHERMTQQKPKPGPTKHILKISLSDLYKGKEFKINIKQQIICKNCNGKGTPNPDAIKRCTTCNGKGQVVQLRQVGPGMMQQIVQPCGICQGKGKTIPKIDLCGDCNGNRVSKVDKTHNISIKPGMSWGMILHLNDLGDEHPDTDQKGDLEIILNELDKNSSSSIYNPSNLIRINNDLHIHIDISLVEALCGFNLVICQLDERKIIVNHTKKDKIIQSGEIMKISGEGMPLLNNPFEKGDMIIHFNIILPKHLDDNRKDILIKILPAIKRNNPIVNENDVQNIKILEEHKKLEEHKNDKYNDRYNSDDINKEFIDELHQMNEDIPGVQCAQQ
jgi:DnaJ-class molecular chaperone